jgi:tetratricopeptide (TPR) repeat protein
MKKTLLFYLLIFPLASAWAQTFNEYLDYAIEYTEEKKHDEAIKVCNKLLETWPSNADIFFLRGVNKYLKSDYEGAIHDFDSTLSLNPNHSDAYLFRAKSKRALKDYWGAFRDLNKAKDENFYSTISSLAGDMVRSFFRKSEE